MGNLYFKFHTKFLIVELLQVWPLGGMRGCFSVISKNRSPYSYSTTSINAMNPPWPFVWMMSIRQPAKYARNQSPTPFKNRGNFPGIEATTAGRCAVASPGLVSPGAATNGVTRFFPLKIDDFFSHRPLQSDDLFSCRLVTTPTFRPRLSSVLSKLSHNFFISFGCVTRGASSSPSDATAGALKLSWHDGANSLLSSWV